MFSSTSHLEIALLQVKLVGKHMMSRTAPGLALTPDQLRKLADAHIAQAARIEWSDRRLRMQTLADALKNLADIKKLLIDYEQRLLN